MKFFSKLFPEEPRKGYHAVAYLDAGFKHPLWGENSLDLNTIKEFIKEHTQAGLNCKIYDYNSVPCAEGIVLANTTTIKWN